MPATLLVSGFLRAHQAAGRPRLPNLERMLARALRRGPRHTHDVLAALFGLDPADIRPGPFTCLADGGPRDDGYRFRADPVHLAPDRDQLVLMPGSVLEVRHEELLALAAAFNKTFGADGWELDAPHQEWVYLRAPRPLDVLTHDPEPFVGGPVLEAMPTGPDSKLLKQLMNETQMLFHTHPVNAARESAGLPTINSLWCWGGGKLPAPGGKAPKHIVSDLMLVLGLATWAGEDPVLPAAGSSMPIPDCSLIALSSDDLVALDEVWFGPLFTLVKSGALPALDVHLEGLGDFALSSGDTRRFWRRSRPLAHP